MERHSEIVIDTKKLCKSYVNGEMQQYVIKNMDIQIFHMDFTVFMGPSGSGKSTLLHILSGMDRPSMGDIYFKGTNFTKYSEKQLAQFRRANCGYVFQQIHLINSMSLMDNVLISGLLVEKNKKKLLSRGRELFLEVGLTEQEWTKYPSQISGGQMGRAGIVRALINNPEVVFADEPTGALDSKSGKAVLDLLTKFNHEGQTVIMVTHDLKSALRGNRILYLKDGRISGECILGSYQGESEERKDRLIHFLEEMGW
ncbi:MAG: ABC transporter ATP-binding protein [Butyrivibrio sp.]|nr:ABC transporter ATP-binding protein [Muribaculum sp.]MCM1551964.1 ABC transporter ATP-binding protein [Butyrivibrio sp.]